MSTALAERPALDPAIVANVLLTGDLEKLNDQQRLAYSRSVCDSLGLNWMTQPFAFIRLSGKLVMYAKKDATDQLRFVHSVSIDPKGFTREVIEGCYVVTAPASLPSGRTDVSTGVVPIDGLKGESRANAMMKAETKAKRRVTLSICGLGMLDETEVESIPGAERYVTQAEHRVELPAGTVQILRVQPKSARGAEWAEVTVVNSEGVEDTIPTAADGKGAAAALCEQLAQEACPVVITTRVTPRSKKTVIDTVTRYTAETPAVDENKALDAELAAAEGQAF